MWNKDTNSITNNEPVPASILCVYTQADERFYRELQTYLSLWQREKYIQWLEISAGSDVGNTMQAYLQQAHLILLLISPDFFAQDFCYDALPTSLLQRGRRQVPVVPVLGRASGWKGSICGHLHALPDNERPIAEWPHPEQAYEAIRSGLASLLTRDKNLQQKLMQGTARSTADSAAHGEHKEAQKQKSNVQPDSPNIINQASNYGAQGVFNGPITFNQH